MPKYINLLSCDTVTSLIIYDNNIFIRHNLGWFERDGKVVKIGREREARKWLKKICAYTTCYLFSIFCMPATNASLLHELYN